MVRHYVRLFDHKWQKANQTSLSKREGRVIRIERCLMKVKGRNAASLVSRTFSLFVLSPLWGSVKIFYHPQYSFYMTTTKLFTLHIIVVCTCMECSDLFFSSCSKFQVKRVTDSVCVKYIDTVQCTVASGIETHQNMAAMDQTFSPTSSLVTSYRHSMFYWYQ